MSWLVETNIMGVVPADLINHPPHYTFSKYEPMAVVRAWELSFSLGNVIKYISRAGRKSDTPQIIDLKKARWYLDEEIKFLEGARGLGACRSE